MATASVVVDVSAYNADEPVSQWFNLLAFGAAADELLRAQKGQMVALLGKLTKGTYTPAGGEPRESWSLVADTVVCAKSSKPTGKPRAQGQDEPGRGQTRDRPPSDARRDAASRRFQDPAPFDDEIQF